MFLLLKTSYKDHMKEVYMKNGEWLNGLNPLRGIAVLMIMFHHISGYWGLSTWMGYVGVSIFAVMSGFLEGYHFLKRECNGFKGIDLIKKKIQSYLPLHLLMFLLAFVLMLIQNAQNPDESYVLMLIKVVSNLTFLQAFIPIRSVYFGLNGVEWYLSIYLYFIFFVPQIMVWAKKVKRPGWILVIIILFQLVWGNAIGNTTLSEDMKLWFIYINPFIRIWDFIEGIMLARMVSKNEENCYRLFDIFRGNLVISTIVEAIYIAFFAMMSIKATVFPRYIAMVWIYSTLSLGLIYVFANNKGIVVQYFSNRKSPLVLVGGGRN